MHGGHGAERMGAKVRKTQGSQGRVDSGHSAECTGVTLQTARPQCRVTAGVTMQSAQGEESVGQLRTKAQKRRSRNFLL